MIIECKCDVYVHNKRHLEKHKFLKQLDYMVVANSLLLQNVYQLVSLNCENVLFILFTAKSLGEVTIAFCGP